MTRFTGGLRLLAVEHHPHTRPDLVDAERFPAVIGRPLRAVAVREVSLVRNTIGSAVPNSSSLCPCVCGSVGGRTNSTERAAVDARLSWPVVGVAVEQRGLDTSRPRGIV